MINAGIKELKNNLSRLLAQVKAGEEIVITKRGKALARIIRENNDYKSIREALEPLVQEKLVTMPGRTIRKERISAIKVPGKSASEMVIEDRR
jgi:prevent-host-death family protein